MATTPGPLADTQEAINFSGQVLAGATLTLSRRFQNPVKVQEIQLNFPVNQQRLVNVYLLAGPTGTSADRSILFSSDASPTKYIVGDDNQVFFHNLNTYIRNGECFTVYAVNNDGVNAHTVDVQISVKRLDWDG